MTSTTSPSGRQAPAPDRALWWTVFALLGVAGTAWVLAAPLMTGPDEVSQARRAAAVVRGQLTGERTAPGPPLLLDVEVPELYGRPAEEQWRCFLGHLVDGTPQESMVLPPAACPDLPAGDDLVEAGTVQYRGQPFFYAWVGLPTLVSTGPTGAYLMRVFGLLPVAALLASAAVSARRAPGPGLAGLALLAATTPAVLYLAASTNPSGLEIAAALGAWAAGLALVRPSPGPESDPDRPAAPAHGRGPSGTVDRRTVDRFGVALVVLLLARGLGPVFGAYVVATLAAVGGWDRCRELLRHRVVQGWATAAVLAGLVSVAWLGFVQARYELPDRPGSGVLDTIGWLPWYLRQSVGVFGTNDSALAPALATLWIAVALAVIAVGVARSPGRTAVAAVVTLVAGLGLSVTAEGLSLPPIGFFWQGRYALPILLGALVLATGEAAPLPVARRAGPAGARLAALAPAVAGLVLVAVHATAFVVVGRHHEVPLGTGPRTHAAAVAGWDPPLSRPALFVAHTAALVAVTLLLTRPRTQPPPGRRSDPQ